AFGRTGPRRAVRGASLSLPNLIRLQPTPPPPRSGGGRSSASMRPRHLCILHGRLGEGAASEFRLRRVRGRRSLMKPVEPSTVAAALPGSAACASPTAGAKVAHDLPVVAAVKESTPPPEDLDA